MTVSSPIQFPATDRTPFILKLQPSHWSTQPDMLTALTFVLGLTAFSFLIHSHPATLACPIPFLKCINLYMWYFVFRPSPSFICFLIPCSHFILIVRALWVTYLKLQPNPDAQCPLLNICITINYLLTCCVLDMHAVSIVHYSTLPQPQSELQEHMDSYLVQWYIPDIQ